MTIVRNTALAAILTAALPATAMAVVIEPTPAFHVELPLRIVPVVNGYGPDSYGLYGHRRRYARRTYGTGYYGRGTRTGGPVGGLPSRN